MIWFDWTTLQTLRLLYRRLQELPSESRVKIGTSAVIKPKIRNRLELVALHHGTIVPAPLGTEPTNTN